MAIQSFLSLLGYNYDAIYVSGRNITCDTWYTNVRLAEKNIEKRSYICWYSKKKLKTTSQIIWTATNAGDVGIWFSYHGAHNSSFLFWKIEEHVILHCTRHYSDDTIIERKHGIMKPEIVQF